MTGVVLTGCHLACGSASPLVKVMRTLIWLAVVPLCGWGQQPLSVEQAVALALEQNGLIQAGAAAAKSAEARIAGARGAFLPQVNYSESWQRSNNQVFVFGSLLEQKQFTAANFALDALNNAPFLNNFQSQVIVDQTLWDNGRRKAMIRSAELGRDMALQGNRRTEIDVITSVLRAYYGALMAREYSRFAAEAVKSAEADLKRAESRHQAGVTTDADVLSVRVHLAAMREREIRARFDVELGLASLNQAMGVDLDAHYQLTSPLTAAAAPGKATANRPEILAIEAMRQMGEEQAKAARAARLPEFYFRAGFEADRQRFIDRGGANWIASAGLRWNLFNGFADRARVQEAEHETEKTRAQARTIDSSVKLETRRASLDLQSSGQRIEVANAAVAMAEESLRIIQNRYEAGLTEVTELLRSETALLETRTRVLEATRDQRLAAVALEAALGQLTRNSEVVVH